MHRGPTAVFERWRAMVGPPSLALLLLLLCSAPAVTQAHAQDLTGGEGPRVFKEGVSLASESLPQNLRLSVAVSHLVALATDDPGSGIQLMKWYGLALERADFELLGQLYGEFDAQQRELQARGVPGEELLRQRAEFTGATLGQWLAVLGQKGHDGEAFLRNVLQKSGGASIHSDSPLSMEDLEQRAESFEEGFEREYGRPLRPILESRARGETP